MPLSWSWRCRRNRSSSVCANSKAGIIGESSCTDTFSSTSAEGSHRSHWRTKKVEHRQLCGSLQRTYSMVIIETLGFSLVSSGGGRPCQARKHNVLRIIDALCCAMDIALRFPSSVGSAGSYAAARAIVFRQHGLYHNSCHDSKAVGEFSVALI